MAGASMYMYEYNDNSIASRREPKMAEYLFKTRVFYHPPMKQNNICSSSVCPFDLIRVIRWWNRTRLSDIPIDSYTHY